VGRRVTFVIDRTRRIGFVETGGLAVETSRTLEAGSRLAKSK